MIVFLLKGWPHCCLWWGCEMGHSYGNCSNSRTLRSFEDPRRVHGDPWQSEAHPNVTSHEQRQVQAVKGKVSEYAWISASGFGEYFCWGISSVFVLLRWAAQALAKRGRTVCTHFCRRLSTWGTKTLLKCCWNLGEFVSFCQGPILCSPRAESVGAVTGRRCPTVQNRPNLTKTGVTMIRTMIRNK